MGEGLAGLEPISCYTSIRRTVEAVPGTLALVHGERLEISLIVRFLCFIYFNDKEDKCLFSSF